MREKHIALEEVTTARPGQPVPLELTYRNVASAELLVYAVDLMTLYLRERNLSQITSVNLAGISPTIRRTVALGEGRDLRPREKRVELKLPEPGAYLVICRGDELFASGLVLVSELEVKEDPIADRPADRPSATTACGRGRLEHLSAGAERRSAVERHRK